MLSELMRVNNSYKSVFVENISSLQKSIFNLVLSWQFQKVAKNVQFSFWTT